VDETNKIKQLRREGFSPVAISNMLQINFLTVSRECCGVEPLRNLPDLPGMPPPPGLTLKVDGAARKKIAELRAKGYGNLKIAEHLGLPRRRVEKIGNLTPRGKLPPLENDK
jgi:hypothetical protein